MLNKKILRDIWKNKSQFITIFIMVFLAVFAFAGVHSYMDGMRKSAEIYYSDQNLEDLWLTSENFSKDDLNKVKQLDNVKNAERLLTIKTSVVAPDKYTNPDDGKKLSDLTIECNFIESNEINQMYIVDGNKFSKEQSGLWLDYYLADKLGIKVGDEIELSMEGTTFKENVVGLVEVPDHVYSIKDETAIFPTHTDYGFAYLSINEFPVDYIYNKILDTDEVKDGIKNLKDLKEKLNNLGITNYELLPAAITNSVDGIQNINLAKALELVDTYSDNLNNKQEFIKALKQDFTVEDSYMFPFIIVDVDDVAKLNDTKTNIKNNLENVITITTREENTSWAAYQSETEEGETYSGVFSGLFVFIAVLSVVTTMNRFVKKERIQIGTLKALGIRKRKITRMYVNYGLFISVIASILGIVLGTMAIGETFLKMELSYYEIPYYQTKLLPIVYYMAIGIVVVITGVTYLSCRKVLKEPAATALRIERPKVKVRENSFTTKKIFNKLSFGVKWNIRDILRSKARTLMALVGISGCTMLVVTALGMLDSMKSYVDWEFGTINNFEYKLSLATDYTSVQYDDIINKYGNKSSQTLGVEFKNNDEIVVKALTVNDAKGLLQTTDHDRKPFEMKNTGLYITEKLANNYGIKVGDKITWHIIGSDNWYETEIVGFNRDPQAQQFNCTKEFYDTLNEEYKADSIYTNINLSDIKDIPGVNTIQSIKNLEDGMNSMLGMMYSLIGLLIVVSVILAFVIIYNLGILSFSEKEYQFATLKVLGFKNKLIKNIFIKQNIWISVVAILLALPLGNFMTDFIFKNAIGDTYDFSAMIKPMTFIISAAGTFVVSYVINQFLGRKVKKLDMVSSLKGNE
ncbi:MAG: ABC transporter permease [Clostridia bacterium]|nr:ABC transporter permease [Clostridia bacterium]